MDLMSPYSEEYLKTLEEKQANRNPALNADLPKKFKSKESEAKIAVDSPQSAGGKQSKIYDFDDDMQDPRNRLYSSLRVRQIDNSRINSQMNEANELRAMRELGSVLNQSASKMGTLQGKRSDAANFSRLDDALYARDTGPIVNELKMREQDEAYELKRQALYQKMMDDARRASKDRMDMNYKQKSYDIDRERLEEMKRSNRAKEGLGSEKIKASEGKLTEPKKLSPDELLKYGEGRYMTRITDQLGSALQKSKNMFGPGEGRARGLNPYDTPFKNLQSELENARQTIGKYKEGGVLRAEDVEKYTRMLPNTSDTYEAAVYKLDLLRRELIQKHKDNVAALKSQGYNVAGLELDERDPKSAPTSNRVLTSQQYNAAVNKTRKYYSDNTMVEEDGDTTE